MCHLAVLRYSCGDQHCIRVCCDKGLRGMCDSLNRDVIACYNAIMSHCMAHHEQIWEMIDEQRLPKIDDMQARLAQVCKLGGVEEEDRKDISRDIEEMDREGEEKAISKKLESQVQIQNINSWVRWHATTISHLHRPQGWADREVFENLLWLHQNRPGGLIPRYPRNSRILINRCFSTSLNGTRALARQAFSAEELEEIRKAKSYPQRQELMRRITIRRERNKNAKNQEACPPEGQLNVRSQTVLSLNARTVVGGVAPPRIGPPHPTRLVHVVRFNNRGQT